MLVVLCCTTGNMVHSVVLLVTDFSLFPWYVYTRAFPYFIFVTIAAPVI